MFDRSLLGEIRDKFHHVDAGPYQGPRAFFENAGGSLTLKSVVEVNARLCAIPDNQGRDNPASHELVRIIARAREDRRLLIISTGWARISPLPATDASAWWPPVKRWVHRSATSSG